MPHIEQILEVQSLAPGQSGEHPEAQEIDQGDGNHPPAPRLLQRLRMALQAEACRDRQLRQERKDGAQVTAKFLIHYAFCYRSSPDEEASGHASPIILWYIETAHSASHYTLLAKEQMWLFVKEPQERR